MKETPRIYPQTNLTSELLQHNWLLRRLPDERKFPSEFCLLEDLPVLSPSVGVTSKLFDSLIFRLGSHCWLPTHACTPPNRFETVFFWVKRCQWAEVCKAEKQKLFHTVEEWREKAGGTLPALVTLTFMSIVLFFPHWNVLFSLSIFDTSRMHSPF